MPAYVIVEVTIHVQNLYDEYKLLTPDTIAAFDGKFVVRGGESEVLEGGWKPDRIVILEFPSVERAKEWWSSEQYTQAKAIRQRAAHTKMIVVSGL